MPKKKKYTPPEMAVSIFQSMHDYRLRIAEVFIYCLNNKKALHIMRRAKTLITVITEERPEESGLPEQA